MSIALLIVQGVLGLLFIVTGSFKFFKTREEIIASGGKWAEDVAAGAVKSIAFMEMVGGLANIAGLFVRSVRLLAPIGAAIIAIIMCGAIITHLRRKEWLHALINLVFLAMACWVVFCRP